MKLHSLGNDFVVIDGLTQHVRLSNYQISCIANRHEGVGCDQVLLIGPPPEANIDFSCRIFNADGHEVGQCGNGLRCVGRFIKETGLCAKPIFNISTITDLNWIEILEPPLVSVKLAPPVSIEQIAHLEVLNQTRTAYIIDLGNPHCIFFVSELKTAQLTQWGKILQTHPLFPEGVNVSFVKCIARNHIQMMTYERGVGLTFACGSGASAAVIAGQLGQQLGTEVRVDLPKGHLTIHHSGPEHAIQLTGPTTCTFWGQLTLGHYAEQ